MPASKKRAAYSDTFEQLALLLNRTKQNTIQLSMGNGKQFRRQWYGYLSALEADGESYLADALRLFAVEEQPEGVRFVRRTTNDLAAQITFLANLEEIDLTLPTFTQEAQINPGNMSGIIPETFTSIPLNTTTGEEDLNKALAALFDKDKP